MEENLHKDNLEEFFKNSFDDENIESRDDQWDVPSDAVWTNINDTINPVGTGPASTSIFTFKKLITIAAGILILGLVYYNYTLQNKVSELKEVVENQKNTIGKLEKMILENKTKKVGSNDLSNEKEKTLVENERNVESEFIEELSSLNFKNEKSKTSIESTSKRSSQISPNQQDFENHNSNKPESEIDNSVNNSPSLKPSTQKTTKKEEIARGDQKIETSSIAVIINDSKTENIQSEELVFQQESQSIIAPNSTELKQNSFNFLMPLSTKIIFAEANLQAEELILEIIPISENVLKPLVPSASRIGFYAGAHIAPTYGYRNIKSIDGPVLRRLLNQQEKAIYSVSLGLKGGYQFSKNWSVETGLNYYKNTVQSKHRAQVRYQSQLERLNSDGNFDSNYQINLPTSYGEIETDVALTRSSDVQIIQNDYINIALKTQQELKNLGIPIAIRYRTAGNKFHFSAKAGISANFILQKDVMVKAAVVTRNGVHHRRTIVDKQFTGLKNTTIDLLLGIGLDYDISKDLSIYFEPTVARSLNPVYQINGKIKTYPILASFNIGLAYHF